MKLGQSIVNHSYKRLVQQISIILIEFEIILWLSRRKKYSKLDWNPVSRGKMRRYKKK
jgi:hypothetical protein